MLFSVGHRTEVRGLLLWEKCAAANHTEDRGLERRPDDLYDRLEGIEGALIVLDD
jgi:hypothetical protein